MIELESSKLLRESDFYRVNIGPSPRGSMIVRCLSQRATTAIIWDMKPIDPVCLGKNYSVRVIPLVGCSWDHCHLIEMKIAGPISSKLDFFFDEKVTKGHNDTRQIQAFGKLSHCILQLQSLVSKLLERAVDTGKTKNIACRGIYHGLKSSSFTLGHVLDRYDLLDQLLEIELSATEHAQHVIWGGQAPPVLQRAFEIPYCADSVYGNKYCLVCFDDIHDNCSEQFFECWDCGHRVCKDCFRGYLISSASEGVGSIKCPAVKCPVRMSIIDIAHILFLADDSGEEKDGESVLRDIFSKLLRFSLERYLPSAPIFSASKRGLKIFCTNPVCDRLLVEGDAVQGGINPNPMLICHCGTTICSSCKASHFGLSCVEFSGLMKEIDSGKLSQEIQSEKWLKSNTKPCPNCSYPIQKSGGCNHMWCQQCRYYFCWVCGGEGQKCNAYTCSGGSTGWAGKVEDDALSIDISNKAAFIFRLQSLQARMKDIDQSVLCNRAPDDVSTERQLCQVLLWLYTLALYKSTNTSFSSDFLCDVRDHVEIAAHALMLRRIAKSLNTHPIFLIKNCSKKKCLNQKTARGFDDVSGLFELNEEPKGPRKHSTRKKQALKKKNKEKKIDTFRAMSANHELFRLCNENETCFLASVSKILGQAVGAITGKANQKRRSKKKKINIESKVEENGTARKENLNTIKTSWQPWREGYVKEKKIDPDSNNDSDFSKKQKWKGKEASKEKKERLREKLSLY